MNKLVKIGLAILLGFIILAIIFAIIPGGEDKLREVNSSLEEANKQTLEEIKTKKSEFSDESPAKKLAILDADNSNPSESTIKSFDAVLKSLDSKCTENDEGKLADYIVFSQEKLEEKQVNMSLLEIAQGINNSIPSSAIDEEAVSCAEVATAFVIMTNSR